MTKMLQIKSFAVGLLFVMHALAEFSTAHDHQGKEGLSMTRKHVVLSAQKEVIDRISKMGGSRMIGLGGRKMVAHKVLMREVIAARPAGLNGEISTSSKNSGKDSQASKVNCNSHGRPQSKLNQQGNIKILERPRTLESAASSTFGVPRGDEPKQQHSQDAKTEPNTKACLQISASSRTTSADHPVLVASQKSRRIHDHGHDSTDHDDETRRLLKATREMVSLMHKDYKGMGHRKPPINNHEPSH